jgi:hypothetical protein
MRVNPKLFERDRERCGGLARFLTRWACGEHGGVWLCSQNEGQAKALRTRLFRLAFIRYTQNEGQAKALGTTHVVILDAL